MYAQNNGSEQDVYIYLNKYIFVLENCTSGITERIGDRY